MGKIWKEWKLTGLFLIGIVILAFVLRFARIILYQQPVFADEAIYIRWAQVMRAEPTLRFLPLSDGKQPLFMWCMIPIFKVINDPLIAGRLLSTFSGLLTLIGIFILTLLLFKSKRVSLFAALIYAISPYSIFFDSMALVDSMLSMFGVWTLVFALFTVKHKRLDYAMLTGFTLGGAWLTKSPALFFSLTLPLTTLFVKFSKGKEKTLTQLIKLSALFVVIYGLSFGIYNILRLGPNFHMVGQRNQDYIFPLSHLWTNPKDPFLPYFDRTIEWIWQLGPGVLVFLVIIGILLNINKYKKEVVVLLFWGILPILVQSEFAKVFTARYIFFVLPYIYVLASLSILSEKFKIFIRVLVIIFIIHALSLNFIITTNIEAAPLPPGERSGYLEEWTSGTGIKEVSQFIIQYSKDNPSENIVVGTEGYFGTLPDGLQMYLTIYPEITVIGVGIDLNEVPRSLSDSKKAGNTTFLVINSSRIRFVPEEKNLKILAVYPKAFRRTDGHEYQLYGPRDSLYLYELVKD